MVGSRRSRALAGSLRSRRRDGTGRGGGARDMAARTNNQSAPETTRRAEACAGAVPRATAYPCRRLGKAEFARHRKMVSRSFRGPRPPATYVLGHPQDPRTTVRHPLASCARSQKATPPELSAHRLTPPRAAGRRTHTRRDRCANVPASRGMMSSTTLRRRRPGRFVRRAYAKDCHRIADFMFEWSRRSTAASSIGGLVSGRTSYTRDRPRAGPRGGEEITQIYGSISFSCR